MAARLLTRLALLGTLSLTQAQKKGGEDLVLCDCGIGDNHDHPDWSTSRQMNWYDSLTWPDSAEKYPVAPSMAVEVPYGDGIYPWVIMGSTAKMPNGDSWTAYVETNTPEGVKAGTAVGTRNGGETLNCWAYRGRPVSAALNKTVNHDAICWSAFVCNKADHAPSRPSDMPTHTSSLTTSTAPPVTSVVSQPPSNPTQPADQGMLSVDAKVNPRFINWPGNWQAFINSFIWDQVTGNCVGNPYRGNGYTMTFECAGTPIDSDTHMTLLMIKALNDLGERSLWFNQAPVVPSTNGTTTTGNWVVMPQALTLTAMDGASQKVIGSLSYKTTFDNFLTGPCSTCETQRFNAAFFDPIIEAMKGTYPEYNDFHVQAICDPWIVCY